MATLCRNPYVQGSAAYDCGSCLPCRRKRRRLWTHRLMLESLEAQGAAFVTLTYRPENTPVDGSLVPEHLQSWLKRLREMIAPRRVRFYAVGEYGDETSRPHYHVALFGYGPCLWGRSQYTDKRLNCCSICDLVRDTWGHGFVYLGELEVKSCMYIAGYMLKKMTKVDDPRLKGRHPEFARMSLRPGIGAWAMDEIAHSLMRYKLDEKLADVPESLRHGAKLMPLGRYLRRRLRERIGRDPGCPESVLEEMAKEMQPLSRVEERYSKVFGQTFKRSYLVKEDVVAAGAQAALNQEARAKINKGRKVL